MPREWHYEGIPRYLGAMDGWIAHEIKVAQDSATATADGPERLLLGVLVYGVYVERFLRLCLPSLMAPGNLPALHHPQIVIHTDAASAGAVLVGCAPLMAMASVDVRIVPNRVMAMAPENVANKYWMLGAAQTVHVQQAKHRGCGYHMLMPDHVYADGYFAGLQRLKERGARAVVQGSVSAQMEALAPILVAMGGILAPTELVQVAFDHIHPQMHVFTLNRRGDLPPTMLVMMVGADGAHIVSPHASIVYLSHDVVARAPLRLFNTIDSQLPWLIPDDVEPVVPGPDDGMVYVELSDASKPMCWEGKGCSIEEFCARFWIMLYCVRGFERFFGLTTVLPFPPGYRPSIGLMSHEQIESMKNKLRVAIRESWAKVVAVVPEEHRTDPIEWAVKCLQAQNTPSRFRKVRNWWMSLRSWGARASAAIWRSAPGTAARSSG